MKSFLLLFTFLLIFNCKTNAQQRKIIFSETATVDSNRVTIKAWHDEKNTFVFNSDEIFWYNPNNYTSFQFPKKTTGYEEDGRYYERYEVSHSNPKIEGWETVIIKWYTKNGSLNLYFPDRTELFKGTTGE